MTQPYKDPAKRWPKTLVFLFLITALLGIASSLYFYNRYHSLKNNPNLSQEITEQETSNLVNKVGKLIDLPKDESPTIATVQDKEKLKDQPFFADAENGDKILIYPQSKKAIIYRQKENRLINVGPIAITSSTTPTDSNETGQ